MRQEDGEDRDLEIAAQLGVDLAVLPVEHFTIGMRLQGVILTVGDDQFQSALEPFVGVEVEQVLLRLGLMINLDEPYGTGFGAQVQGDKIELDLGFSNKIYVKIPGDLEVKAEKGRPTTVTISGADKQRVGQLAAMIRSKRPPTPYADNKGVRYRGEVIRKKAGKAFGDKK